MIYEFAPLEGITGYVYRNAHSACFGGIERYYTPFITPKKGKSFTSRELNDVLPEHNEGIRLVPQILTNQAEGFLKVADRLREFGYREVNLNLGCPSGTVVAKHKGAGFLDWPVQLDAFLEEVFARADVKISVKTRLGLTDPEEFGPLLEIFNKYPICLLIIHPRVQKDFYGNVPRLDAFERALLESKNPVCYNGDLFERGRIDAFAQRFSQVERVMLGRGLLVNPGLLDSAGAAVDAERIRAFLERLAEDYARVLSGERDVLFKMKELWFYLGKLFPDGEKQLKAIRKAQTLAEYKGAVREVFSGRAVTPERFF